MKSDVTSSLNETIIYLNKSRHKAIFFSTLSWCLMGIFFISFFVFIFLGLLLFSDLIGLFLGLAFLGMVLAGLSILLFVKATRNYKKVFQTSLIKTFNLDCYKDLKFSFNGFIRIDNMDDKMVFNKYKGMGESLIEGKLEKASFSSCYYEYTNFQRGLKNLKGRIIMFKLDKVLPYRYLLEDKDTKILFKKLDFTKTLETESIVFNKNHTLYVDDTFKVLNFITPSFINRINDFTDLYKCHLNILAQKDRVYVAVNDYNYFTFSILKKVDEDYALKFRQELLMPARMYKVFSSDLDD